LQIGSIHAFSEIVRKSKTNMTFDTTSSTAVLEPETDLDLSLIDLDSILEYDITDSVTGPGGTNQIPG
jgi:hypothetical protein